MTAQPLDHEHGELFLAEADLVQIASRLSAIEQTMQEFQKLAWALLALASRSPVHLDVEHLEVERLEFNVDSVDVGELSGEMNIGLTSRFNLGQNGRSGEEPEAEPGDLPPHPPAPQPAQPIWPPGNGTGGDDGDSFGNTRGAGTQQSGPTSPPPG